ncbi:MAG: MucR family transcriptional regulator [Pseudorhizobium pelagicum]|uniref:MucR family transcriptional regulator n=1 Tax=Pseudorhizobium pelagicum TaxID=1509405 RepID=UPI0034615009
MPDLIKADDELLVLTTDIVSAYLQKNVVHADNLPNLISAVHSSLSGLGFQAEEIKTPPQAPAVPIKKSIKADAITCLECGVPYKSLKRHLTSSHQQTADEYRSKWGLSSDYPMVAPDYAEARSNLAKQMGLGQSRTKAARTKQRA